MFVLILRLPYRLFLPSPWNTRVKLGLLSYEARTLFVQQWSPTLTVANIQIQQLYTKTCTVYEIGLKPCNSLANSNAGSFKKT